MKYLPSLKVVLILCFLFGTQADVFAVKNVLLKESMKKGLVSVKAISTGGYIGKCLKVNLKNNSTVAMNVQVDPALIFVPDKDQYQHLVAVGEEQVLLKPHEEKSVMLQTFCGKASAHGPGPDINYKYWKQGDSAMVLACRYIKDNGLFNDMGQHAVWMFTDNHSLSNIYYPTSNTADVGKKFVKYLAGITGREIPQFYTVHKIGNGRNNDPIFDPAISKVYVDIDWNKEHRRNLRIFVYNQKKEVYKIIETGEVSNSKSDHHVRVVLDPLRDPAGTYVVQLRDDENNIWIEKKAMLGEHYN